MSIPGDASPLLLGGGGPQQYKIERSLRFNSSDSAYLSRTPASAGNRKTFTWSGWVKRATLSSGGRQGFFNAGVSLPGDSGYFEIGFVSDSLDVTTGSTGLRRTSALFRDTSAWLHILVAVNTTEATASNRVKVYINGTEQTQFSVNGNVAQNTDTAANNNVVHAIGREEYLPGNYFDGYLADVHLIDGQALDPTSFAETNITTGQWVPKAYTGTYGTNGFRLAFADNSNNTATTLGKDSSPNGNNWTPNNLSVTAGAGNDSLVDTPTSYGSDTGAGGEVRGNYCTWNPLNNGGVDLSNGNLDVSNGAAHEAVRTTIKLPVSGKWYAECALNSFTSGTNVFAFGVDYSATTAPSSWESTNGIIYIGVNSSNLIIRLNGSDVSTQSANTSGAVLQVAYDADGQKLWLGFNNTWKDSSYGNTGNPGAGTNPTSTTITGGFLVGNFYNSIGSLNTGQRPFAYTAPSGFKALCDTNLPAPVVAKPNSVFDVKLYTGNGSTQTISGLGFSPDLVWIKSRSVGAFHGLWDQIRGTGRYLGSNTTIAEGGNSTDLLSAFNSDGFSVNTTYLGNFNETTNQNSETYVAWAWDAGSSTVTNTQGSITSQVRANASAGFSIVSFTAPSSNQSFTVGHGLNVTPAFTILKRRDNSLGGDWWTWHIGLGDNTTDYLALNQTTAEQSNPSMWGTIGRTSSLLGFNAQASTVVNGTYIVYCFAPVAGYSSFGSYTGNGSADGPFVYTGFRPRWILWKRSDSTGAWILYDTARNTSNVASNYLQPHLANAEASEPLIDIVSNGFKIRVDGAFTGTNVNNGIYVWAAFAENPFQYARAR